MLLPEGIGLGVEIDKEKISKTPYSPRELHNAVPFRNDGSVAFSV